MRKIVCSFAVLVLFPLAVSGYGSDDSDTQEKKFSQALTFMVGMNHRKADSEGVRSAFTFGWEGWITRSRVFGFYLDGTIALEDSNSLGMLSYGISLALPKKGIMRHYFQLGFMYGKGSQETEYYAMPVTMGTALWFTRRFGIKCQVRYQAFCKDTMLHMSAGLFAAL